MNPITSFINDMSTISTKLDGYNSKIDSMMSTITEIKQRLAEISNNAPVKPVTAPTEEIKALAKSATTQVFNTSMILWRDMLTNKDAANAFVLWDNGVVTTLEKGTQDNPVAIFRTRAYAIWTLRNAGYKVPYSTPGILTKFVIATR